MSHVIDKILSGGAKLIDRPSEYRSFIDSGHRPQMGFAITCANGDMHGFLYHTLDNMQLQARGGAEFLSFTHRSKAVTIQGEGLEVIFRAMMRHTLMEIAEPDGRPSVPGMPIITRMEITTVGAPSAPAARLVK
jgi:hypothetical protein